MEKKYVHEIATIANVDKLRVNTKYFSMIQNVPFSAPTRALRLLFTLFGKFQLDAVLVRSRQVALVGEVLDNLEEQRKIFL